MKLSRPSRFAAALFAIVSMLFMQFAIATYACPGSALNGGNQLASTNQLANSGCDGMDARQPTLCHAHSNDQASKQSLDKPELPQVAAFASVGLTQIVESSDIVSAALSVEPESLVLTRTTAPPIAIRNCCFRI